MNFKFSRRYSEYKAVQSIGVCCYSNTNSAGVLLEQQLTAARLMRHTSVTKEDCSAFYGE
jgi:hypothetical protein